jgi:hypothetical protein
MEFFLIDFSPDYYGEKHGREAPPRRRGKFVQIRGKGGEYLVLSPTELCYYHANIVERFFLSIGMEGSYNRKGDIYSVAHPDWEIAGGGMWDMDDERKTLKVYGHSQAYGNFNGEGLRERILSLEDMKGYSVQVGSGG